MNILKQVDEILTQQNPSREDNLLEQLSQVLEYHHGLNDTEIAEGIRLLLAAALQEENSTLRETFLSTISTAVSYHDMRKRIDWDGLVARLSSRKFRTSIRSEYPRVFRASQLCACPGRIRSSY